MKQWQSYRAIFDFLDGRISSLKRYFNNENIDTKVFIWILGKV